jgi:nicotinate-nucleotide pyrophosphorylase (carboxylating)
MMTSDVVSESRIVRIVELALLEDIGTGDRTTDAVVAHDQRCAGVCVSKEDGVIAGLEIATLVFEMCDPAIRFSHGVSDGQAVHEGATVASLDGPTRGVLRGERTALNFLQRMSGIATLTRRYVRAVDGTRARITDTRKTAPGLRALDKQAVVLGGGVNHRFGLDDMVLIKDNHIVAAGGIQAAIELCKHKQSRSRIPIEVETKNLDEVREALACGGIDRIMLDNFQIQPMREAVDLVGGRVQVEASGGITLDNVRSVAETGVDFISVGALTHSAKALDISLEVIRVNR